MTKAKINFKDLTIKKSTIVTKNAPINLPVNNILSEFINGIELKIESLSDIVTILFFIETLPESIKL